MKLLARFEELWAFHARRLQGLPEKAGNSVAVDGHSALVDKDSVRALVATQPSTAAERFGYIWLHGPNAGLVGLVLAERQHTSSKVDIAPAESQ